jgi:hypothetical protein
MTNSTQFHCFFTIYLLCWLVPPVISSKVMLIPHPQIHSLMKSFGSTVCAKNVNIPSPKSQSPKKEPAPKARRPLLNWGPAALPHASEIFEEEHVGTRRSSLSKPDTCDKPPEAAFYVFRFATPRAVDIDKSLLKQNKKPLSRRQSGLIAVGSGTSSSNSSSSSTKSCTTSTLPRAPSPASALSRRDAGLAERKKRRRRSTDENAIAAQRLQDVTNSFGSTRASLPPLSSNVFEQDGQRMPTDTDSDMPSSALTYSSSRALLSTLITTLAPSHLPTPRNPKSSISTAPRRGGCRGVDNGP